MLFDEIMRKNTQVMGVDICIRIGRNIRGIREHQRPRMTQEMLAGFAGCSRKHIVALESGRADVGIRILQKVADALNVTVCELVK